jgi:hypothetical protein
MMVGYQYVVVSLSRTAIGGLAADGVFWAAMVATRELMTPSIAAGAKGLGAGAVSAGGGPLSAVALVLPLQAPMNTTNPMTDKITACLISSSQSNSGAVKCQHRLEAESLG